MCRPPPYATEFETPIQLIALSELLQIEVLSTTP